MGEEWEGIAQVKIELFVLKPEIGVSFPLDIRKYLTRSLGEISSFYRGYSEKFLFENLVTFLTENYKSEVGLLVLRDEENRILGFAVFSEKHICGLPFSSCFLKYLYVDPVYRGKGLGKLLLKHLKTKFKAIGLLVEKGEEQAKAFYEKQGFQLVGTLSHAPTGKMY